MSSQHNGASHLVSMASASKDHTCGLVRQAQERASGESELPRKRKRKTYSCLDCRRRKLKCDRESPCGRCVKEGHPASCTLHDEAHESENEVRPVRNRSKIENGRSSKDDYSLPNQRSGQSSLPANQHVVLQRKIALLESRLAEFESNGSVQDRHDSASSMQHNAKTTFLRGASFRTQFYGLTNPSSLFAYFPGIFSTSGPSQYKLSPVSKIQHELMALRQRRKDRKKTVIAQPVSNLASLLPFDTMMDRRVQLYLDIYDTTFHVFHKPSFWAVYHGSSPQEWKEPFVAIVLLMIAVTNCVAIEELRFKEDVSSARLEAQRLVMAVEDWSLRQSQKHLTIETFQIQLLLMLAKTTNSLNRKRAWCNSGFLLRLAMSSGFQRDPRILGEAISVFDQEMRRRLWTSVVEWDLSASLSRGLPPTLAATGTNCEPPMNIDDADIGKGSNALPKERPLTERTDTSYLRLSSHSLSLRSSLTSLLNDSNNRLSWSEALSFEEQILQEIQSLPRWTNGCHTLDAVLLHLQLRQYTLWLYISYSSGEPGPKTAYARMATITVASQIIDLYSGLNTGDMNALNMLRNDMFQNIVALSLTILSETQNASLTHSLITSLQPTCEKAFLFLEDKVLKVGEGYNYMWFASAVFATAQTALEPKLGDARILARERISAVWCKVLSHQEPFINGLEPHDPSTTTDGTANTSYNITPKTTSLATSTAPMMTDPPNEALAPLDLGDFSNTASWLNEDFWGWDPAMFQL